MRDIAPRKTQQDSAAARFVDAVEYQRRFRVLDRSSPAINIESSLAFISTDRSLSDGGAGHENVPFSSRLCSNQNPEPSKQRILSLVREPLQKTKRWPEVGSCLSTLLAIAARPSNAFRMSVLPAARKTRTVGRSVSMRRRAR